MTDHPLPERVGPYRIERKLGAGGMGTVYRARHEETGREAAVKVLPASLSREPGLVERFSREIEVLNRLESPHIVRLLESGVVDDTYYYAMELIDGETLADRLEREKRSPWREAVEIAVQICKALKSAHNAGIVHRDLKPSNLLIDRDGVVKLTDFGVAQMFAGGKLTVTGGVIGTAEYMSPEQAQGRRATKHSDIYALGAVLYVMLTGRPPFTGKSALDVAQKHRFGQFDSPRRIVPEIPRWLDEIVCTCLEKKPEDRYPDAYVLSRRLQEVPRKVDLSQSEDDLPLDGGDASAETVAAVDPADIPAEGGATLMRDLFRAHVEQERQRSPVTGLFDNLWFLLGVLALLILGGVLWHQSTQLTPEERFARGEELMRQPPGAAWEQARSEYFQPLLEEDPDEWQAQVAPHLDRIAAYEIERELLGPRAALQRDPQTEPERFLQRALEQRDRGDLAAAEQTLQDLAALLELHPDDEWERATRLLLQQIQELRRTQPPPAQRLPLLSETLDRIDELAEQGELEQARALWNTAARLYHDDPAAQSLLNETRAKLGINDEQQEH